MATSPLQAAATLMQPTKLCRSSGATLQLRPVQSVGKAFGVEPSAARLSCSLQDFAQKCTDAAKIAGFALATSALVVSGANAEGVPKRLTFDEIQSKTYLEVKGSGTANQCPTIDGGVDSFAFKPGKYNAKKFCLEPTSFTVKAESVSKNAPPEFQNTKLNNLHSTPASMSISPPLNLASEANSPWPPPKSQLSHRARGGAARRRGTCRPERLRSGEPLLSDDIADLDQHNTFSTRCADW